MPDTIRTVLPYVTGVIFVFGVLALLISLRMFRRSRTDVFWRRRREAGRRGWRLFLAAFVMLAISALTCALTAVMTTVLDHDEPTPVDIRITGVAAAFPPAATETSPPADDEMPNAPVPTETPTPLQTPVTPTLTPVVIVVTTTPVVTPTETLFPTFTPNVPSPVSSVTPRPNARIVITALDDQISDALLPVNPRNAFSVGTERIYMFVEFRNMTPGVLWKRHLYRDGDLVDGSSYLWGLETEGRGYFFFGSDGGFLPGSYEIRLFIGDAPSPVNVMPFTIVDSG